MGNNAASDAVGTSGARRPGRSVVIAGAVVYRFLDARAAAKFCSDSSESCINQTWKELIHMRKVQISSMVIAADMCLHSPQFRDDSQVGGQLEVISRFAAVGCLYRPQLQNDCQFSELIVIGRCRNQRSEAHGLSGRCSKDGDYS